MGPRSVFLGGAAGCSSLRPLLRAACHSWRPGPTKDTKLASRKPPYLRILPAPRAALAEAWKHCSD